MSAGPPERGNRRASDDAGGEIRTLFMVGVPEDCSSRELRNMFRFCNGFEGCLFTTAKKRGRSLSAFVLFDTQESALAAKTYLEGQQFDTQDGTSPQMTLELAKTNLKLEILHKWNPDGGKKAIPTPGVVDYQGSMMAGGGVGGGGGDVMDPSMMGWMPQQQQFSGSMPGSMGGMDSGLGSYSSGIGPYGGSYGQGVPPVLGGGLGGGGLMDRPKRPRTSGNGSVTNTLYVSNLSGSTTDDEVKTVFTPLSGFVQVVFARKAARLFAFVEFVDEQSASAAMDSFQGYRLISNTEAGGMNISYSRDPIRRRPGQ